MVVLIIPSNISEWARYDVREALENAHLQTIRTNANWQIPMLTLAA